MLPTWNAYAGWSVSALAASAIGLMLVPGAMKSNATPKSDVVHAAAMPVAQQNILVQKYCAVCHDDVSLNGGFSLQHVDADGGFSLQHFDAAHADPGLAAMLLNKLTNGVPLERVSVAITDQAAAAAIDSEIKKAAINAAGIPKPDSGTTHAWAMALSAEAANATKWTVNQVQDPESHAPVLMASVTQEVPAASDPARADMYRLRITCGANTRKGEMELEWAPRIPPDGQEISVVSDGKAPLTYKVEWHDTMGKPGMGSAGKKAAPGYIALKATPLPEKTLTVHNLLGGEAVVFPFNGLPRTARHELSACFANSNNAH